MDYCTSLRPAELGLVAAVTHRINFPDDDAGFTAIMDAWDAKMGGTDWGAFGVTSAGIRSSGGVGWALSDPGDPFSLIPV